MGFDYAIGIQKQRARPKQQLSTLSEGDSEPTEGITDTNRISAIGNSSLPVQAGRNEILLGDQSLRQESRYI